MHSKRAAVRQRVWRITTEAPLGEFVDIDPAAALRADPAVDGSPKVLDPAPVVDWRASSYDLLNGVEVRDHSDAIPSELFDRLFKR